MLDDDAINRDMNMKRGSLLQHSSIAASCSDVMCSRDHVIDDCGCKASHNIPLHEQTILTADQHVCHDITRHHAAPESIPSSNDSSIASANYAHTMSSKQRQLRRKSLSRHSSPFSFYINASASWQLLFGLAILLLLASSSTIASSSTGSIHKKTNLNDNNDDIIHHPIELQPNTEMPSTDTTTIDTMTSMATTSSPPLPKRATTQEIMEASSICKSLAQSQTSNNNGINNINTHLRMKPLRSSSCHRYVSCNDEGSVLLFHTCPDDLLFDVTIQICNWPDRVECPEYPEEEEEGGGDNVDQEQTNIVVIEDKEYYDSVHNDGTNNNDSDEEGALDVNDLFEDNINLYNEELLETVCVGKPTRLFPIPTTGCKEYVSCVNGEVALTQECPDPLIFDINIQGCNWASMVECRDETLPPTLVPTGFPTEGKVEITPMPTVKQPPSSSSNTGQPPSFPTSVDEKANVKVYEWLDIRKQRLNDEVFQSVTFENVRYRSYWFQYNDFIEALKVSNGDDNGNSITGDPKHSFYLGNRGDEWEYGVINIAVFLAHAMTTSIKHDACDEFHTDMNTDVAAATGGDDQFYAISNSCGQYGLNYGDFHCGEDERHMECVVDPNLNLQATTSLIYPSAPPPLTCRPRSVSESYTGYWDVGARKEKTLFPYENAYGRTDVEGCCYFGRGAIHTRGVCNLGKLNYFLGKKAADDGRLSRYPTTDFCAFPEAICAAPESKEMRWLTSMFEWTERVQSFDDRKGFNYLDELRKFVDGGLIDLDFFHATSGILDGGCLDPPCAGSSAGMMGSREIHLKEERLENFQTVLMALDTGSEKALLRGVIKYFTDLKDVMNGQVLRSQTPQGQLYPSYRYTLSDMLASITFMAETGVGGRKFYIGEPTKGDGVKYGIVNIISFLAQAYKEAIQFDACDENNWQLVNDRFPISNSCGQLGMSYQDMHCREDEAFMECPVKPEMEQYALTSALWFQAPGPFKCGPRSKFPTSGYWDYDLGRERNDDAYANSRGRVDIEGCCWWGRGVIQTRGVCNFGKLNYFMGARAAREGRPALYPDIDFCEFPQGVCSSDQTYGGQMQWTVGLFEWTDRIQTYSKDGWNYMDELKKFVDGGYKDFSFIDAVSGVVNIGCHDPPCQGFGDRAVEPHNKRDRNDAFQRFLNQLQVNRNFRAEPPPTPLPTLQPTVTATEAQLSSSPTVPREPTQTPTFTPAPTVDQGRPPLSSVVAVEEVITSGKGRLTELVLRSEHPSGELWPSYLYTWSGLLKALRKMTTGVGPGEKNFFYVGDGESPNSLNYGLVNIAAFLADGLVKAIHDDTCDELSYEMVNGRYPLSNSCGQNGLSYQDEKCTGEEEGMECPVDTKMVVEGVTHARWLGAPPPFYCGDRTTGYWDHAAGLERQDPPFENAAGRSDVRGCCWWGRGVGQVRGVCSYGRLNHFLGAKAEADGRPSIYPDIDFCTNPGIICSGKHSEELRWVTGMFRWSTKVQKERSRDYSYMDSLQNYVDDGNFTSSLFIDGVNDLLSGGNNETNDLRSETFFNALRAFGLIEDHTSDATSYSYCGESATDAGIKCELKCVNDFDCPGSELCQPGIVACENVEGEDDNGLDIDANVTTIEDNLYDNLGNALTGDILPNMAKAGVASNSILANDHGMLEPTYDTFVMPTTYYCGENWEHASSTCLRACPGGNNAECLPNQQCFADVTACSRESADEPNGLQSDDDSSNNNYCGKNWNDASFMCFARTPCRSGKDIECPDGEKCYAGIRC